MRRYDRARFLAFGALPAANAAALLLYGWDRQLMGQEGRSADSTRCDPITACHAASVGDGRSIRESWAAAKGRVRGGSMMQEAGIVDRNEDQHGLMIIPRNGVD